MVDVGDRYGKIQKSKIVNLQSLIARLQVVGVWCVAILYDFAKTINGKNVWTHGCVSLSCDSITSSSKTKMGCHFSYPHVSVFNK